MRALAILFFLATLTASSQPMDDGVVINNLKDNWKFFSEGKFENYNSQSHDGAGMVYFIVDPGRYVRKSHISIRSAEPFTVYLNYKLIKLKSKNLRMDIDSLQQVTPQPWLFGVHQVAGLSWLKTEVLSPVASQSNLINHLRPSGYYLDLSIIIALLLITYFILLLRTNPRLTMDYMNFVRLFSIQEREDTLLNSRISASSNILYYVLSSLFAGFILLTIFHFGAREIAIAESFVVRSSLQGFFQWIKLSGLVMIALLIKLVVITGLSKLFEYREAPVLQFYNFIRLIFFVFILSGFVCLCYFVFKIQSPKAYSFLLSSIIFLLGFWIIVIGLKLLRRTSFRFFQLFSYLCASELIPIVILVKVLNS